jgi:DNA sulfur modification protein DndD
MILQKLTLRNFGLFRGTQVFDLAPAEGNGASRPVVLVGGINGGGKTTVFDAIQLALYGSRARCSKRAARPYDDFLRESIHHGVPPEEGAGVTLSFHYVADGECQDYEVRREWKVQDDRLRETLTVLEDGFADPALSRSWPQVVEEWIPLEISQLFFFDGEKIRTLAEDAGGSEALGAAIKALLGLDIVERLIADAAVLQTRLIRQAGPPEQRAEAEALEEQFRSLTAQQEAARIERSSLENRRERAEVEEKEAEDAFAAVGGKHWNERHERRRRLNELETLARDLEGQLVTLAAGELPLALVPDLLEQAAEQDEREVLAAEAEVVAGLLSERDERLLEVLREARAAAAVLRRAAEHLAQDREARRPAEVIPRRLALSESGRTLLRHFLGHAGRELLGQARDLLGRLAEVTQEREDLERALAATPEAEDVGRVAERLKAAAQNLALLNEEARRLDEAMNARKRELEACQARLLRLGQGQMFQEFQREDQRRMIVLAARTRETMQEFLRRATARKIDRLAGLITESFRYLLRKQTLVQRVGIDPETFAITLYDGAGLALPRQRLSEGEKQLFAVAMLWGLARASARPLPAVIDTPMARLDDLHRRRLVERYFPSASHQVIVLSTDTEVDRTYFPLLKPAIARAYHLRYDEETRMTVAEEGYFWREEREGA